jgi:hypothetical protein
LQTYYQLIIKKIFNMKKLLKYLPQILFAAALIFMGAIGKLTGAAPAVDMFTQIDLFGQGEAFGRILVGLGQLAAGIGVFFKPTRKIAAVVGIVIMAGAIFYSVTLFGASPIIAIVVLALGVWILLKGGCKGCCTKGACDSSKKCDSGKCCEGETCDASKKCEGGTCPAEKAEMSEE